MFTRQSTGITVVVMALVATAPRAEALLNAQNPRCNVQLADGTYVRVDNATTDPDCLALQLLVRQADASTRVMGTGASTKGLIKSGDRLLATNYYLAWFDYSVGDGTAHPNLSLESTIGGGAGGLAGVWSRNPNNGSFRYRKTIGGGWAPNELIRGSATNTGYDYWWDGIGAGGVGHSIWVGYPDGTNRRYSHWDGQQSPSAGWYSVEDGVDHGATVVYKTNTWMASQGYHIDVVDDNDGNGFSAGLYSSLTFSCDQTGITVLWNVWPTANVKAANILAAETYLAYSESMDGTTCDFGPAIQWPASDVWWGQPKHVQSNRSTVDRYGNSCGPFGTCDLYWPSVSSNAQCPADPNSPERVFYRVTTNGPVQINDWMHVWSDYGSPNWTITNLLNPTATWTDSDGFHRAVPYDYFVSWNEMWDGAAGISFEAGPYAVANYKSLDANTWYATQYRLSSIITPPGSEVAFGGMYQVDDCGGTSGVNSRVNPLTGGYSCPASYSLTTPAGASVSRSFVSRFVGRVKGSEGSQCGVSQYLCTGSIDPGHSYASPWNGLFQIDDCGVNNVNNALRYPAGLACAPGTTAMSFGRFRAPESFCGAIEYFCYGSPGAGVRFGGVFQKSDCNALQDVGNPARPDGAAACPPGTSAFQYGRVKEAEGYMCGANQYVCVSW